MMLADAQGDVDTEKVLRMAALHESSEALTGDIPRPARSFFPSGATETIELSAGQSLFEKMPDPDRYKRLLSEYIDCKSPEAQLVRAADKLQMLCKVRFYQKAGATNLHDFFENDQGMDLAPFPVAQALFDLLSKIGSSTKHGSEA
jgi:putative hydrolase of HD superfamily